MPSFYDVRGTGATAQATSTGTADVKTLTPPAGATGCLVSVETNDARATFDGSAPAAGNGVVFKAALQPVMLPFAKAIKFASVAAANSIVNVTWLFN